MVFHDVAFEEGNLSASVHKAALKRLQNAIKKKKNKEKRNLDQTEFIVFKRILELYVKSLKLQVVMLPEGEGPVNRVSLATFCRERQKTLIDLLIEAYDIHSAETYSENNIALRFNDEVDEIISDDILSLNPPDLATISMFSGPHRVNQIVRHLGSAFYLGKSSNRSLKFNAALTLQWKENESIQDFNSKFTTAISACKEVDVFTLSVDQVLLYLARLSEKRQDNQTIVTARSLVDDNIELVRLDQIMKAVARVILNKETSGKIPFDSPTIAYTAPPSNQRQNSNNSNQHQRRNNGEINTNNHCIWCAANYSGTGLRTHLNQCPAKGASCTDCGRTGQLSAACRRFKAQRIALLQKQGKLNRNTGNKRKQSGQTNNNTNNSTGINTVSNSGPLQDFFMVNVEEETGFTVLQLASSDTESVGSLELDFEHMNFEDLDPSVYTLCTSTHINAMEDPHTTKMSSVAILDTGASCMALNDIRYFETVNPTKSGQVNSFGSSTKFEATGIARFKFGTSRSIFRFPAYYIPSGQYSILSDTLLRKAGFQINYSLTQPTFQLPTSEILPITYFNNLPTINLQVIPKQPDPQIMLLTSANNNYDLWHKRTLHLSAQKLYQGKLINSPSHASCNTCQRCKGTFGKLPLDKEYKSTPESKGDIVAIDLMQPKASDMKAFLVSIDYKTRFVSGVVIQNKQSSTLLQALKQLLIKMQLTPKQVVMDRQSGWMTSACQSFLENKVILVKLVPPHRHGQFNPFVERVIYTLRTMARTALDEAGLSSTFWPFAVTYAV